MKITLDIEREEAEQLLRYVELADLGNVTEQLQEAIENADEARYNFLEEGKIL